MDLDPYPNLDPYINKQKSKEKPKFLLLCASEKF